MADDETAPEESVETPPAADDSDGATAPGADDAAGTTDGDAATAAVDEPASLERVRAIGCTPGTEERLVSALTVELTDETPQAIVVSTRASLRDLPTDPGVPVIALVHPGGGEAARRFLEAGVAAAVPEGREELVGAVLGVDVDPALTGPLRQLLDAPPPPDHLPLDVERALAHAVDAPTRRIAVVAVPDVALAEAELGEHVSGLLRVRIERAIASARPDLLWARLDDERYVVVFADLAAEAVDGVAQVLADAAGTFRRGDERQALHVGHAGAEDSNDPRIQLDLAHAACDLAALERRPACAVSDVLERRALPQAAEVLLELADAADLLRPDEPSSRRVAEVAAELATAAGWDPDEVDVARLAGRLHAVGMVGVEDDEDGSRQLALSSSRLVGLDRRIPEAIARHTEPVSDDGPPEPARLLAVALVVARTLQDGAPLATTLAEASGLDPELAGTAADRFGVVPPEEAAAAS